MARFQPSFPLIGFKSLRLKNTGIGDVAELNVQQVTLIRHRQRTHMRNKLRDHIRLAHSRLTAEHKAPAIQ